MTDPESEYLVTAPSKSPESDYLLPATDGKRVKTSLTYGVTYDMQIIGELFENTAAAARVRDEDPALIASLDAARAKLLPMRLDSAGRIMEWIPVALKNSRPSPWQLRPERSELRRRFFYALRVIR